MIPARYAHIAFSLLLSGMMSFMVSGVSTFLAVGPIDGFVWHWMGAWIPSWGVAFPMATLAAPVARRIVMALTIKD